MHRIAAIVIGMVLTLALSTKAQDGLTHGFKVGVASSDQTFTYTDPAGHFDPDRLTSFAAGVFLDVPLTPWLGVRPELTYIEKGGQTEFTFTTPDYPDGLATSELKEQRRYVSFPVSLRGSIDLNEATVYVVGGPRLDIEVGKSTGYSSLLSQDLKTTLLGATVGVGTIIPVMDNGGLLFEVQYMHDFTKVYETDLLEIKNRAIVFFVGYRFDPI